jgi:hypothetical protein
MTVSLITQRVIYDTDDISVAVGDYRVGTYALNYQQDKKLYIAGNCPFNNLWFELSTISASDAGIPIIEVWYNGSWYDVVDIIDQTQGMTKSGRISWSLHIDAGWNSEQKSETVGLSSFQIYNRYWLRIGWPSDFLAGVSYIGQKFSDDTVLSSIYPDLLQSQILSGFKAGKTNWNEQHFLASEAIVKDLRKRNFAVDRGQIMDWSIFEDAACHKVAEIVYQAFGTPYREHVNEAKRRYQEEMSVRMYALDVNQNGHVEVNEITRKSGYMTR